MPDRETNFKERKGAVLVVALLIMAIMSAIGTAAFLSSRTDIGISHSTKVSRQAFYAGDGGLEMSPKYIRKIVEEYAVPVQSSVTLDAGFLNEVMGYTTEADNVDSIYPVQSNPDLRLGLNDSQVVIDVDRKGTSFMTGSGVEFAAGSEGAGAGGSGGVMIFYNMDSLGMGPASAISHLDAYYRYVVGVAGGK